MSSAVKGDLGINSRLNTLRELGGLDGALREELSEIAAPAVEDLVDGDQVVARDGVELGHRDGLGKQDLLTLGGGDLRRLLAHLGRELELAATLEGAEPAAEMKLDVAVVAKARLDVGPAERVSAARALAPADLRTENSEDDLLHLSATEPKSALKHSCYVLLRNAG